MMIPIFFLLVIIGSVQLSDLLSDPAHALSLAHDELVRLTGENEALRCILAAAWAARMVPRPEPGVETKAERLLTVKQAAQILNVSTDWLYRHQEQVGQTKLSDGQLRFSIKRLQAFIDRRSRRKPA
jgi:hypothetical protein